MKLTVNALAELFALRHRRWTYAQIAERLRLPVDVIAKACRHKAVTQGRRNVEAVEIPSTARSLWFCPECRATLEAAPCVKCGGIVAPIIVPKKPTPRHAVTVPGIRELNARHPGRS